MDPFRLDGKRAVVTGAGKGIGRGIAVQMARAGADLVVASRTREDLESLAEEIGPLGRKVSIFECDVTDPDQISQLAAFSTENDH